MTRAAGEWREVPSDPASQSQQAAPPQHATTVACTSALCGSLRQIPSKASGPDSLRAAGAQRRAVEPLRLWDRFQLSGRSGEAPAKAQRASQRWDSSGALCCARPGAPRERTCAARGRAGSAGEQQRWRRSELHQRWRGAPQGPRAGRRACTRAVRVAGRRLGAHLWASARQQAHLHAHMPKSSPAAAHAPGGAQPRRAGGEPRPSSARLCCGVRAAGSKGQARTVRAVPAQVPPRRGTHQDHLACLMEQGAPSTLPTGGGSLGAEHDTAQQAALSQVAK